ncbi:MAG TPA: cupin domain-containing protein [Herpetosiphonaceae bacterium]|nr:cupin domain-containing protein [Herpetosiphonaceae bacterium]
MRAAIHSHPHEQIGDVLAGEIDLIMEPMETMRLAAGSSSYVAPNVKHGIAPRAAPSLLDCLTPVREEFLEHERRRER